MASWLLDLVGDGTLNEILAHLNRSSDAAGRAAMAARTASLSSALDELGGLLRRSRGGSGGGGRFAGDRGAALAALLNDALSAQDRQALLSSAEVGRLVVEGATVEKLASLLCSIERQRDKTLVQHAVSVQELIVHLLLQRPEHKLAAYGTLVPGDRNHVRVAHLRGAWQRCFVRGRRWVAEDGDPRFRWSPADPELDAMLLVSEDLPSAWPELDRFEGSPYRRHLVPVRAEDGHHVASLYESADPAASK